MSNRSTPHHPDRPRGAWPAGQGPKPGMIDSSPAGRRLLATLIVIGILAVGLMAVVALFTLGAP